jgi:hypothetical protein
MKNTAAVFLGLVVPLAVCAAGLGQAPGQGPCTVCTEGPPCAGGQGLHWTTHCFPPNCCPDDYCPNPFPRLCWPPYPPFYRCVPAGDCGGPGCAAHGQGRLTWWFLPTPRALFEALWCHP